MKILLASDAWAPQVNGVVRTWEAIRSELCALGHQVEVLEPSRFMSFRAPCYPEIRIAVDVRRKLRRIIEEVRPDAIHVATEGPVGGAMWRYCRKHRIPFTTSFHTHWAQYNRQYFHIPERVTWRLLRGFHGNAATCLVPTERIKQELERRGLHNVEVLYRGVDPAIHHPLQPGEPDPFAHEVVRPVLTYVGRVAIEKNLHAFLDLPTPGTKVVVGDGPLRAELAARYPHVRWVGYKAGRELGRCFAASDVVVMPSRTETFGLVALESAACGTPVAAYPVAGPADVIVEGVSGALDHDLDRAVTRALAVARTSCVEHSRQHTWRRCAEVFLRHARRIDLALPSRLGTMSLTNPGPVLESPTPALSSLG